ncbi:hypothetical protein SPSIL_023650 [Sporomusa silvacetica DSM 10669]|uniref:Uncharacterized protein n=1 Tax=Sporomusa silvacetica DSM 10669 TaxID=1123289 RepID=A0ABZ3IKL9_9FIRM|nr:hypothetical protein [Sporomusa silvacetica]OZC13474.1 hypothetical protein SPSIL_54020 [Sporomusa silvacetica DSM 10669]
MYTWATLVLIILVVMGSVWLRVCRLRMSLDNTPHIEPKTSPFSNAVQDLVATAGGVYLSLVMIVSFLKLELPERITISIITFDPLAMTAITVAVIQPVVSKLFESK